MMREFTIKINGVDESIDLVQALIDKLNQLESSINSLGQPTDLKSEFESIKSEITNLSDNTKEWTTLLDDTVKKVVSLEDKINKIDTPLDRNDLNQTNQSINLLDKSVNKLGQDTKLVKPVNPVDLNSTNQINAVNRSILNLLKSVSGLNKQGILIKLGDTVLLFNNANQAIRQLRLRLIELKANGEQNTETFRLITSEIVRLLNASKATANVVKAKLGNELTRAVRSISSLSNIASLGTAFQELFGGNNLIGKSLLKLTALSLILTNINQLQRDLINNDTTLFKGLNKIFNLITYIPNKLGDAFSNWGSSLSESVNLKKFLDLDGIKQGLLNVSFDIFDDLYNKLSSIKGLNLSSYFESGFNELIDSGSVQKLTELLSALKDAGEIDLNDYLEGLEAINKVVQNMPEEYQRLIQLLKELALSDFDSSKYTETVSTVKEFKDLLNQIDVSKLEDFEIGGFQNLKDFLNSLDESAEISEDDMEYLTEAFNEFGVSVLKGSRDLTTMLKTANVAGIALKAFGKAVKGALSIAGPMLFAYAISEVIEGIQTLWSYLSGAKATEVKSNALKEALNGINYELEEQKKLLDDIPNPYERLTKGAEEYRKILQKINELPQSLDNLKYVEENLDFKLTKLNGKVSSEDELKFVYEKLREGRALGEDINLIILRVGIALEKVFGKPNIIKGFLYTVTDTDNLLKDMLVNALRRFLVRLQEASRQGIAAVRKLAQEAKNTPMIIDAYLNLDNLDISDSEKLMYKLLLQIMQTIIDLDSKSQADIKKLREDAAKEALARQDRIRSNEIASILDEYALRRATVNDLARKDIRDAKGNAAEIKSIRKRLKAELLKIEKDYLKAVQNINFEIELNRINLMKDGLPKTLALIELNRKKAIAAAKESGIKVGELIKTINDDYDNLILEAKKKFYEDLKKLLDDFAKYQREINDLLYRANIEALKYASEASLELDLSKIWYSDESLEELSRYFDKVREINLQAAKGIKDYNDSIANRDYSKDLDDEKDRHEERLKLLKENLDNQLITQLQYDEFLEKEENNHNAIINDLYVKHENELDKISREYKQKLLEENAKYFDDLISIYLKGFDKIADYKPVETSWGFINISKSKEEINKLIALYKKASDDINKIRLRLGIDFSEGRISNEAYLKTKDELDNLSLDVKLKTLDINKSGQSLVQDAILNAASIIQQYMDSLNTSLDNVFSFISVGYDEQQSALEKEYDLLEEAYSKQEELVLKHSDKLNEIEDELSTARGDRRAYLIELLNAEREALIAALLSEEAILKEKDANQKKLDALEKKRKKLEKLLNIQSGIMNTFMAATNALTIKPFTLGIILASLATATGLAYVAKIAATKIYRKGGLLNGASHEQGGIPVGNTGIEVEGNEYIVNKRTTMKNLPLLNYINSQDRKLTKDDLSNFYTKTKDSMIKYESGGLLPINIDRLQTVYVSDDRPVVVSVVDIVNQADNYRNIRVLSGLN